MATLVPTLLLTLLASLLGILTNLFIALAINNDARARDLQAKTTYSVLAFFFPVIVGIVYACTRKNAKKNNPKQCAQCGCYAEASVSVCPSCNCPVFNEYQVENAQKLKKTSIIFLIIAIVLYVISSGLSAVTSSKMLADVLGISNISIQDIISGDLSEKLENSILGGENNGFSDDFDLDFDFDYYDMNGNKYSSDEEVIYYAKDGSEYNLKFDEDLTQYFVNAETGEKLDVDKCYVDENGYFVYDANGDIELTDNYIVAKDSDGNVYYPANIVSWNENGELLTGYSDDEEEEDVEYNEYDGENTTYFYDDRIDPVEN